jgi:hypothetical protein
MVIARAVRGTVAMVAVRAAFWLKRCLKLHKRRSEAAKHLFDDVVRPYAKSLAPDLGRHMPVAEMPRESHQLTRLRVSDVDDGLRRRSNDKPRPVVELHTVSIGHRDRCGQIEKDLIALIGDQAEAPPMPMIEIEGNRPVGKFLRPFTGASMNDRPLRHSSHISTRNSVVPWAALTRVHM